MQDNAPVPPKKPQKRSPRQPSTMPGASSSSASKNWEWTEVRAQAALDVARSVLSIEEIAKNAGIDKSTLNRWRKEPAFSARVAEHREEIRNAILSEGIADIAERTKRKNETWLGIQATIRERAAKPDPELQGVPEGKRGLYIKQVRSIGRGEDFERIVEVKLDTASLDKLDTLELQAARELGQLTDKVEHSGVIGLTALDPTVAYGYPLGALHDILQEFLDLVQQGIDPLAHFAAKSQAAIDEAEAKKKAAATGGI